MNIVAATRIVLLPDDTTLVELLGQAEQLLELITTCERDTAEDPAEPRPWRLPAPVANGVATSALSRIARAVYARLTPAGVPRQRPRLFAPARRYEHHPLRRVTLAVADVETLAAAARVCHQALQDPNQAGPGQRLLLADLRELLASLDEDPLDPTVDTHFEAVGALDGVAALTAARGRDLDQLDQLVDEAGDADLLLPCEAEQAYQRVADWMNTLLTGGDPLERWAW